MTLAEQAVFLPEELSKDMKRYEPLWSLSEFSRMKSIAPSKSEVPVRSRPSAKVSASVG